MLATARHFQPASQFPRHWSAAVALLGHLVLLWGLWHLEIVPRALAAAAPLMVALLAAPASQRPPEAPASLPRPRQAVVTAPAALETPVLALAVSPLPAEVLATQPRVEVPADAVPAALLLPHAAPSAAPRRQLPATAVQYQVQPPAEVPRASRRAGESGTVWLRVVVDASGAPAQVSLHRSSGHARLDEQALWAMRRARFKPHTEDGRAIEVEVIAPIEYPPA